MPILQMDLQELKAKAQKLKDKKGAEADYQEVLFLIDCEEYFLSNNELIKWLL